MTEAKLPEDQDSDFEINTDPSLSKEQVRALAARLIALLTRHHHAAIEHELEQCDFQMAEGKQIEQFLAELRYAAQKIIIALYVSARDGGSVRFDHKGKEYSINVPSGEVSFSSGTPPEQLADFLRRTFGPKPADQTAAPSLSSTSLPVPPEKVTKEKATPKAPPPITPATPKKKKKKKKPWYKLW